MTAPAKIFKSETRRDVKIIETFTVKNKTLQLCSTLQFSGGTLSNRGMSLSNINETVIGIYTLSNRIESLLVRVNPLYNKV